MNLNEAEKVVIFWKTKPIYISAHTTLHMWKFRYVLLNMNNCVWTLYHLPGGIETENELRQFGSFSLQVKLQKACKWASTSLILLFLESPLLAWTWSLLKLFFLPAPTKSFIHNFGHTVCQNRTIFSHFFTSSNAVPGHTTCTLKWITFWELFPSIDYNESQVWK